jgi:hypothetical protein
MKLQEMIDQQSIKNVRWYQKEALEAIPIPILGPDLIDPRDIPDFQEKLSIAYSSTDSNGDNGA